MEDQQLDLGGRVAVVTGASRGLGAGLARRFVERGMKVGLCARVEPARPAGGGSGSAVAKSVDVTDAGAVERFAGEVARRLGPIDLWVNNAGVLEPVGPVRELDPEEVRRHLDVNVLGVLHGTQAFLRAPRGREPVLVNISSGAAQRGRRGWAAYCAGKAAVDRITEVVAAEERGIRALAVAPGVVNTEMQDQIRREDPDRFPDVDRFRELEREGRFNSPQFVADRLLALAFDPDERTDDVVLRLPDEWRGVG